jgi:hypothetical protein
MMLLLFALLMILLMAFSPSLDITTVEQSTQTAPAYDDSG